MQGLGKALRQRAAALKLSDSEVARRAGLSQARYHNYVSEVAEPDLGTLMRICRILATSPDGVLDFAQSARVPTDDELHRDRMMSAASVLEGEALVYTADLVEAMVAVQRKRLKAAPDGQAATGSRKPEVLAAEPAAGTDVAKSRTLLKPTRGK